MDEYSDSLNFNELIKWGNVFKVGYKSLWKNKDLKCNHSKKMVKGAFGKPKWKR